MVTIDTNYKCLNIKAYKTTGREYPKVRDTKQLAYDVLLTILNVNL